MGRLKGAKNKKPALIYPRKCNFCDYVSNNPSMWHYHNRTHDPIPEGTFCDHGCNRPALFRGTGGKFSCEKVSHRCPAHRERLSKNVKGQWRSDKAVERKEKTKSLFLQTCAHNEDSRRKGLEVIRNRLKSMTPLEAKQYVVYSRAARKLSRRYMNEIICGVDYKVYQIDHIVSLYDCWKLNLSVQVAAHLANCRIVHKLVNASKGKKSWLTVEALYEKIEIFESRGPQISDIIDNTISHVVLSKGGTVDTA